MSVWLWSHKVGTLSFSWRLPGRNSPSQGSPPQAGAGVMPQLLHSSTLAWPLAASSGRAPGGYCVTEIALWPTKMCNASITYLTLIQCSIFLSQLCLVKRAHFLTYLPTPQQHEPGVALPQSTYTILSP